MKSPRDSSTFRAESTLQQIPGVHSHHGQRSIAPRAKTSEGLADQSLTWSVRWTGRPKASLAGDDNFPAGDDDGDLAEGGWLAERVGAEGDDVGGEADIEAAELLVFAEDFGGG